MRRLTDPGDLVRDPFAGSCGTGIAARNRGRKCGFAVVLQRVLMTVANPKDVNAMIPQGGRHDVRADRMNANRGARFVPHRCRLRILCKKRERPTKPSMAALGLCEPEGSGTFQVDLDQVLFG